MTDTKTPSETPPQTGDRDGDPTTGSAAADSAALSDQKRLIDLFSDGKLPTGDNFADLINSMVTQSAFDDHVGTFTEWTTRSDIQIGQADVGWQLLRRSSSELGFQPDLKNAVTADAALIDLFGWTKSYGHYGTLRETNAFSAAKPNMALDTLACVASDGRWKVLMEMPGRVCAFDLVLATAEPDLPQKPGLGQVMRWLVGYVPPENAILRVTATATGPNREPHLTNQSHTVAQATTRAFKYLLLALAALAVLTLIGFDIYAREVSSGIVAYIAQQIEALRTYVTDLVSAENMPLVGGIAGGLALAYLARRTMQLFTARHNGLQLRWKQAGGSRMKGNRAWRLEAKGPDMGKGGQAKLYYHITALWG